MWSLNLCNAVTDVGEIISIRRRQLEVPDVSMFTLHQLLTSLQTLFLDDVISATVKSESEEKGAAAAEASGTESNSGTPHSARNPSVRLWMKDLEETTSKFFC